MPKLLSNKFVVFAYVINTYTIGNFFLFRPWNLKIVANMQQWKIML